MRMLVLLAALLLPVAALAEPALVVADCQVRAFEGERFVVRLRSTGPQAFDVLPDGAVRLHGARATGLVVPEAAAFGSVVVAEDDGGVVARVVPSDAGWRVTARQGSSANVVELRVGR